ncbi:MAG TPA: hypothetical protein PLW39_14690 [Thermoflexales bacterium]|nr:hypothetical protein [Thermoflexales bacterium]HQX74969.1 hypothetical protein [Thermoflexales bacterium]HQZ23514.1 hypothetical protein [Thermoflexales bacterium]
MAKLNLSSSTATSLVNILREVDVRAIRDAAEMPFTLVVISRDLDMAKHVTLALNRGPRDYDVPSALAVLPVSLNDTDNANAALANADLTLILARASGGDAQDAQIEIALAQRLEKDRRPCAAFLFGDARPDVETLRQWHPLRPAYIPAQATLNDDDLVSRIAEVVAKLPNLDLVCAARHVPGLRKAVTAKLTSDAANANAGYALGTGLMEIVPVANVPLNVADMVILTKNQGIMAYKIALAHGMNSDVKTIMPQVAGVIGGGFVFRTVARTLVGLVPVIGIVPKVAVSYAGTVAIGEAIQRWCASGEQMSGEALQKVFNAALVRGRALASELQSRVPRRGSRVALPPPQNS